MKIIWSNLAKEELREIHTYFKVTVSKKVADSITEKLVYTATMIKQK